MTIKVGFERTYCYALLVAWVLCLGNFVPRIGPAGGENLAYGIGVFFAMTLMPVWLVVGPLVLLASLAFLVIGNWTQRMRVIMWFSLLAGFVLFDDKAYTLYGWRPLAFACLILLGGLTIYWLRHPASRQ